MYPLRLTCILELLCVPCAFLNRLSCCPLSVCFYTSVFRTQCTNTFTFWVPTRLLTLTVFPRIPNANFSSTRCCVIVHIGEHFPALMCVFIRSYLWPPILGAFFVTIYSCTVPNHPLVLSSLPKNSLKKNLSMSEHSLEVTFLSFKLIQQRNTRLHYLHQKKSSNIKKENSVCSLGMNCVHLLALFLDLIIKKRKCV